APRLACDRRDQQGGRGDREHLAAHLRGPRLPRRARRLFPALRPFGSGARRHGARPILPSSVIVARLRGPERALIGTVLDKYEVIQKVGEGGMATVYLGRHTTLR